jgi:hypothetical protein
MGGSSVAARGSGKKKNKKNRANSVVTLDHVLFILGPATTPLNAARS